MVNKFSELVRKVSFSTYFLNHNNHKTAKKWIFDTRVKRMLYHDQSDRNVSENTQEISQSRRNDGDKTCKRFNSFGAKFRRTFIIYINKLSLGKPFICKVERLNVSQRRSR